MTVAPDAGGIVKRKFSSQLRARLVRKKFSVYFNESFSPAGGSGGRDFPGRGRRRRFAGLPERSVSVPDGRGGRTERKQ